MNKFQVSFDYTGRAPVRSTLLGWIQATYSNVQAQSDVIFIITTPDSEDNVRTNMERLDGKKYTGGQISGVEVEEC